MFDFKNVKAIIFDFGGVIINLNRQASVDKLIELGVKDADSMLDNYVQSGLFAQLEAGEISADQFHNLLREKYQLSLSDEVIDDAFYRFLLDIPDYKMKLIHKLHDGVYNAKGERIRILVLSNTNEIQFPYCMRKFFNVGGDSVDNYFDKLYLSYEMKMTKPSDEIFLKLLSEEGIKPEEAVFLDDGPANIETVKRLGMQVYHVAQNEDYSRLFVDIIK